MIEFAINVCDKKKKIDSAAVIIMARNTLTVGRLFQSFFSRVFCLTFSIDHRPPTRLVGTAIVVHVKYVPISIYTERISIEEILCGSEQTRALPPPVDAPIDIKRRENGSEPFETWRRVISISRTETTKTVRKNAIIYFFSCITDEF